MSNLQTNEGNLGGKLPKFFNTFGMKNIKVNSTMAMDIGTVERNIEKTFKRNLPNFWDLPEVFKFKGDTSIAIVAGGPSVNNCLDDIKNHSIVMVCGSAHDHIIESGIIPDYCIILDPDAITANYIKNPVKSCMYLVASQCDDAVFQALEGFNVVMWHCAGGVDNSIFKGQPCIGGGCTVTLRAISVSLLMGYGNQHFYGFDSCLTNGEHHAYDAEDVTTPVEVIVHGSDRKFLAAPFMIAQATQFQDMIRNHGKYFTPTVHGNGLIAEIMRVGTQNSKGENHVSR